MQGMQQGSVSAGGGGAAQSSPGVTADGGGGRGGGNGGQALRLAVAYAIWQGGINGRTSGKQTTLVLRCCGNTYMHTYTPQPSWLLANVLTLSGSILGLPFADVFTSVQLPD